MIESSCRPSGVGPRIRTIKTTKLEPAARLPDPRSDRLSRAGRGQVRVDVLSLRPSVRLGAKHSWYARRRTNRTGARGTRKTRSLKCHYGFDRYLRMSLF